jgi:hypothetical protein
VSGGPGKDNGVELEPFSEPPENDFTEAVEEAEPYFPPTDPVVRTDRRGRVEIADGFDDGSVRDDVPSGVIRNAPSDEAIADAVREELARDASTAQLQIEVEVVDGVVTLHGKVDDLTDAENAVAVADEVPGVVGVVDDLSPGTR